MMNEQKLEVMKVVLGCKDTNKAFFIACMESTGHMPMKEYQFLSGPFKGAKFLCSAPSLELMNSHPHFKLEFISGKCAGLITTSLISYDQRIKALEPIKWLRLLSNARHI